MVNMGTQTVSFRAPDDMVEHIEQAVEDGNYTSKGEFLRDLVRNVEFRPLSNDARDDIRTGRQQDGIPLDEL